MALLLLETSFWSSTSDHGGCQDLSQRCPFNAEQHEQKRNCCFFFFNFFCRSNRQQVAQEGKNTSKATNISSCCSESRICLHSLSLICQHKITLNWRDSDWACSTGEQQLLWLICVASQVRLMKMVEIMEHRVLKCPLVLFYFFFSKFFIPRKIKLGEFKAFKRMMCI